MWHMPRYFTYDMEVFINLIYDKFYKLLILKISTDHISNLI